MALDHKTRYAKSAGASIAYQVIGDGPRDLIVIPGWLSHIDLFWTDPGWVRLIEGFASFARVITFDQRGSGLSDPIDRVQTLETRADDLRAVLDAAGSERAALFGLSMGGPLSILFACTDPERVTAIIAFGTYSSGSMEPDGTPERDKWIELTREVRATVDRWGEGDSIDWAAPSIAGSRRWREGYGMIERASMSPATALTTFDAHMTELDVTSILGNVGVPTLVLHRRDERIPVEFARHLASEIPRARLVELEGRDHMPTVGDVEAIVGEVEEFLTGVRHEPEHDRVLATVLFTDIVDSTRRAAALGDRAWRAVLENHDEAARSVIERYRGREVKSLGDGFLATFDGPARAVRAALTLADRVRAQEIEVRCGVHTGECELRGDDIGGIAVHIGARIGALAGAGEVLVSSTVKELVAGSGLVFADRGAHALKGVPDEWRVYAATGDQAV